MDTNFIPQERVAPLERELTAATKTTESFENPVVITDFATFHALPEPTSFAGAEGGGQSEEEQGYQAGFAAGKAEATAVYQSTIKVMETTLENLKQSFQDQVSTIEDSHGRVVLSCLEAVLPEAAHHIMLTEMKAVLDRACASKIADKVIIKLHADNVIAKEFLAGSNQADFTIVDDNSQSEMGLSITFGNTQTDIDPVSAATQCLNLLTGLHLTTGMSEGTASDGSNDSLNRTEADT